MRLGAEMDTPIGSDWMTNLAQPVQSNAPFVFWDRGYVQFVGFTVGKQRSFFDRFCRVRRLSHVRQSANDRRYRSDRRDHGRFHLQLGQRILVFAFGGRPERPLQGRSCQPQFVRVCPSAWSRHPHGRQRFSIRFDDKPGVWACPTSSPICALTSRGAMPASPVRSTKLPPDISALLPALAPCAAPYLVLPSAIRPLSSAGRLPVVAMSMFRRVPHTFGLDAVFSDGAVDFAKKGNRWSSTAAAALASVGC